MKKEKRKKKKEKRKKSLGPLYLFVFFQHRFSFIRPFEHRIILAFCRAVYCYDQLILYLDSFPRMMIRTL